MRAWLLFALPALLLLAACGTVSVRDRTAAPDAPRLVAYLHGSPSALREADAARLTHVNYAFANLRPDGTVVLEGAEAATHLATLASLRARHPGLKILLSVGGWSWSDHFSDAALTPESRARFARSAAALATAHHLDGFDIDWEYPGQPGEGNTFRLEDRENFTLLLAALRAELDAQAAREKRSPYLVTIAAATGARFLEHTDMAEAQKHLDFVNLMTYDFHGPWAPRTGHHANLHASAATPGAPAASEAVALLRAAGVPARKIVLGAAFYGYGWEGVAPEGNGLGQPYTGAVRSIAFARIIPLLSDTSGYRRVWDEGARAPFLWNPATQHLISYEDEASLRAKAAFVKAEKLGGVMYWQHGHDPSGRLLRALHDALR